MTSDSAGTPTNSPSAAKSDGTTTETVLDTQPDIEPHTAAPAEQDEHASPVEQAKDTARRVGAKMSAAIPRTSKRRWGAFTAAITATAGIAVGWVIRRGHRRKLPWRQ
jgi:hypothetical protein